MRLNIEVASLGLARSTETDSSSSTTTAGVAPRGGPEGGGGFNPLEPSIGLTFWGGIVFVLLLALLAKYAWGPITQMVEQREKRIKADLDGAEKARVEADQTLSQYKRQLEAAAAEAKARVEEAIAKAEKQGAEVMALRRAEADALIEKAKKDIAGERDKALADVKKTIVELALEVTRQIVKRTASQEDLAKTADEVIPRFKTVA